MSDQLNFGPESQPKLRLAAQGDRAHAAGPAGAARGTGGRPAGAGGDAGRRPAPDRLREGGLQATLDGGDGVPAGDGCSHRLHVHGDADLRGPDAPADRSGEPERRVVQGSHRRGSDQGRLLPDAVQHPAVARAGPQDARGPQAVGSPGVQPGEAGQGLQHGAGDRRRGRTGHRPVQVRPGGGPRGGRRRRDRVAVEGHRHVRCAPDRRADPQQPARRREVPLAGCGAGDGDRERAGAELHQSDARVQVLGEQGRERLAWRAARRAAHAGRGRRSQAAGLPRAQRRDLPRGSGEHRRPEADRPELGGDAREDRADPEGSDVDAAARDREQSRGARHVPGDSQQHLHPAAEERAGAAAAAESRSCRRSSARSTRRSSRTGRRFRVRS